MLLVRAKLGVSEFGIGLYAEEDIPKDTYIWNFDSRIDRRFTKEEILAFPKSLQLHMYTRTSESRIPGLYCFYCDKASYMNHSFTPNTKFFFPEIPYLEATGKSIKAISKGEELTCNYTEFEIYDNSSTSLWEEIKRNNPEAKDFFDMEDAFDRKLFSLDLCSK